MINKVRHRTIYTIWYHLYTGNNKIEMWKFYYSVILFLGIYPREIWAIFSPKDCTRQLIARF